MRMPLVIAILAVAATPAVGQRRGQLVRVDAAPATRAWVGPGVFSMGTAPEDVAVLAGECARSENLSHRTLPIVVCAEWQIGLEARPLRQVNVDGFWIDRSEVTVAQYRRCVHAGACPLAPLVAGDPRYLDDAWPQVNIERAEAATYCAWQGGRLPTEAEWEKAARGTHFRTWPWGDSRGESDFNHGQHRVASLLELADIQAPQGAPTRSLGDPDASDGYAIMAPPGSLPGGDGPYGTHDQAGNVAEWVLDAWSPLGFEGLPADNPVRAPDNELVGAMVRGGSWRDAPFLGRTDLPHYLSLLMVPASRLSWVGFRCVVSSTVPQPAAVTRRAP